MAKTTIPVDIIANGTVTPRTLLAEQTDANELAIARSIATDEGLVSKSKPFPVLAAPPGAAVTGKRLVSISGSPIPLGTTTGLVSGVTVTAPATNTGRVFLKASGSTDGYGMNPGESVFLFISRLDIFSVDAQVNGEGIELIGS